MKEPALVITSIACITILTALAIWKGVDGTIILTSTATIAGLAGYTAKIMRHL